MPRMTTLSFCSTVAILLAWANATAQEAIPPGESHSLALKPLSSISIDIRPSGDGLPEDIAAPLFDEASDEQNADFGHYRPWHELGFAWTAPVVAFKPLLFEDVNLERYGHHHGILQPAVSAGKFFGRLPVLPYLRGAHPITEHHYSLGYYRPGDCAPHFFSRPRFSWRGAIYQGTATVGSIFLIP